MPISRLAQGLRAIIQRASGAAFVDESLLKQSIKELQRTLISADVNVKLVFDISRAIEERMKKEKTPVSQKERFVKIVYEELVRLLGKGRAPEIKPQRILLCGTFGHGKTTTTAKIASFFSKRGLKTAMITTDTYRPAAFEQIEQLAERIHVPMFGIKGEKDAAKIARAGAQEFKDVDVLIIDSAGRDSLDQQLIDEIKQLNEILKPDERYLVLGADMGQTASKQARAFNEAINLTGVVVTRLDSSAKGGGALSACAEAGVPVVFIGTGEKVGDFESFDSEKFVGRLLGFPDLPTLLTKLKEAGEEAELTEEDIMRGEFDLNLFYKQLQATKKMGSLSKIVEMMGLSAQLPEHLVEQSEEKLRQYKYIIDSMTPQERANPETIKKSRIERIAKGSGRPASEVRELLKQFSLTKKMFRKLKKGKRLPGPLGALVSKFKGAA